MRWLAGITAFSLILQAIIILFNTHLSHVGPWLFIHAVTVCLYLFVRACSGNASVPVSMCAALSTVVASGYLISQGFLVAIPHNTGAAFGFTITSFSIIGAPLLTVYYAARDIIELQKVRP